MALTKCKECGKEISSEAKSCPNCGFALKKKTGFLAYFISGFLILLLFWMIGSLSNSDSTKPESGFIMPSIGTELVTFDEYERIKDGISYRQVVQIIGVEGEELSRNRIDGIPGVMEPTVTVMYQWVNSNGGNMNAIFQNDKLIQKAQFGLK
ncbi:zinc-ribbon domain-containing protein [Algoriphagus sp. E1-3-M2]|nr:zinc-ribbon domain-containing protein [Algoriphagus sp. E1-3-M2]